MNRRNFFKTVTGFIAGLFTASAIAKEKPQLTVAILKKCRDELDTKTVSDDFLIPFEYSNQFWRFYINGKEVDGSRATDETGCLHWPFEGAKKGDVCTAKSPIIFV